MENLEPERLTKLLADALEASRELTNSSKKVDALCLEMLADLLREIGELSLLSSAHHSALLELLPGFQNKYELRLATQKLRDAKQQYERRVAALLQVAVHLTTK